MKLKYYFLNLINFNYKQLDDNTIVYKDNFNDNVNDLDITLKHIIFGQYFNNNINNLPANISYIDFNYCHNYYDKFKHVEDINYINIHRIFDQKIDNLPHKLNYLMLNYHFNQHIKNLPLNITDLTLGFYFSKNINMSRLAIKKLICYCSNHQNTYLPNSLKELYVLSNDFNFDFLPEGVEVLKLLDYKKQINDLPSSIKEIWTRQENIKYINKMYQHKIKIINPLDDY